jgi:hypothetical protein
MGVFFSKIKQINSNTEINNEQKNNNLPIELDELLQQNKIETQKKFYNVLNREISETDGIGFIYGFTKDNDDKWIKIGRTMQTNPNKRVDQWKGDILFCQKTKNNKKIEILIHLLLKNRNIYRINFKTGAKEIEWFYFDNFVNVPKILAILIEYVDNYSIITTPLHVG